MKNKSEVVDRMKGGLIVSCQAEPELGSQLHRPEHIALMAKEVLDAGACAVRICGAANVKATHELNPGAIIIGIAKGKYPDGRVLITENLAAIGNLVEAGASIVGMDMTKRLRPDGTSSRDVLLSVRKSQSLCGTFMMADLADEAEAEVAIDSGADFVATTLSGYTEDTEHQRRKHEWYEYEPDFKLVERLVEKYPGFPIIAEGRWRDPEQCHYGIHRLGAFAVCVGSQITRPRMQVKWHLEAIKPPHKLEP